MSVAHTRPKRVSWSWLRAALCAMPVLAMLAAALIAPTAAHASSDAFDDSPTGITLMSPGGHGTAEVTANNTEGGWAQAQSGWPGQDRMDLKPAGDGSFQIRPQTDDGKPSELCWQPGGWDTGQRIAPVKSEKCNGKEKSQSWYLVPRNDKYTIRNVASDKCLDVTEAGTGFLNEWDCHGEKNQQFSLINKREDGATRVIFKSFLQEWAAQYGITKCDADATYCNYTQTEAATTGNDEGAADCIHSQHTDADIPSTTQDYEEMTTTSTLTGDSIAAGQSTTVYVRFGGNNDFYQGGISQTLSTLLTHTTQKTETESTKKTWHGVVPAAKAHSTTWLKVLPATKTYTGDFVFSKGSWDEWTYHTDDKLTVSYPSGSTGSTMFYESGVTPDTWNEATKSYESHPGCGSSSRKAMDG
ncbi:RICIN domain-containing protein [Streptomyces tubercidicus]|uniref:RICIN domain-containing protein n=1 Tax=Streptomyces tubercidicus TaxID=47759 RepID=UPI003464FE0B